LRKCLIRVFAVAVSVSVLCASYLSYVLIRISENMCKSEIISTTPSPDASINAVVFERDCGATTNYTTEVALVHSEESPFSDDGDVVLIVSGRQNLNIKWKNGNNITITIPKYLELIRSEFGANGIMVSINSR
jgi:hypothetical protein